MKLILASQSPRRKEILESLGYPFEVYPSQKEEIFDKELELDLALERVAFDKAYEVLNTHPNDCILAADTIVVYNHQIYGKPSSKEEATSFLRSFSGNVHEVKTGVCVLTKNKCIQHIETTKVHFRELSDDDIASYVESGRCMDKAGAYGIQECDFVSKIEGSYENVVGLPKDWVASVIVSCMSRT